jgi:hypothetical protein
MTAISSIPPKKLGYWTTTQATSSPSRDSMSATLVMKPVSTGMGSRSTTMGRPVV